MSELKMLDKGQSKVKILIFSIKKLNINHYQSKRLCDIWKKKVL